MEFNREDVRKMMYYDWKRGLTTTDIAKEINKTLGGGTTTERTCAAWVKKFKNDEFQVSDKDRTGRPSFHLEDQIQHIIDENKHATTREIGEQLNVSHEAVWKNLKNMGKRYLVNVWIPYSLTDANKAKRMATCNDLLKMFKRNNFLHRIVTVDEMWVYWENECSHTHRSWRGSGDEPTTETRRMLTKRKHLATIFWDCKGVIMMDVLPNGQTITAVYYCQLLDKLKTALLEKRRRRTSDGSLYLLQDNARPHTACLTKEKLEELKLNLLPHPPYSPDLAPSDFYLFSPLKSALHGKKFNSAENVQDELQHWLDSKPQSFFDDGIKKLPGRWERCINNHGDYFEFLDGQDD
jgi:histone-lysine N-methyltransferase SETMAR